MRRPPEPAAPVAANGAPRAPSWSRDPRERALARTLGVSDLLARVLLARGIDDPDRVRRHLHPELRDLHDPFAFRAMPRAVDRVREAIARREPIMIHGDYDVDGVTGSVLLLKLFRMVGADAKVFIPERRDGYSFGAASLRAIAAGGFRLCISVDNGTNAGEYVDRIQAAGCDVIVTDHHGTSDNVARAHSVLNPRLPDAGYPDRDLAGVGVAFCLAKAIAASFSRAKALSEEFESFLVEAMTHVALGTVADVAPLRGENRILVHHGLRALAVSRSPGIRALLESANVAHRSPDTEDIAFRIAPLINAAGRMGRAGEAIDLLIAPGYQEAQAAAKVLEQHNEERRKVERRLVDEVMAEARAAPEPILVLGREGWHPGVLGIVAARVAETMRKPTILIAFDGDRGRGSGRSAGMLNLRDALLACGDCLLSHGGHAAAVGLEVERRRLDDLRTQLNRTAGALVQSAWLACPDGEVGLSELDPKSVRKLDLLGPFGAGNPRPVFVSTGVRAVGRPSVDARNQDLRFRVAQAGVVLPARLKHGSARFEEVRALEGPLRLTHSPRLAAWAEDGPVELQVETLEAQAPTAARGA